MRLVRFLTNTGARYGLVDGDKVTELDQDPFAPTYHLWGPTHQLRDLTLLAPCVPTKIVLISGSYRRVIEQLKKEVPAEPLIFIKPNTAVIGPGQNIIWPPEAKELTHEPELAVVIRRPCRNVSPDKVSEYILGYTCLNDISARDIQTREIQFTRGKGYDTFAPLGPCIVTDINPNKVGIRSYVNGRLALESTTEDMIFTVEEMISFVSRCMTLLPGDVISTGASGLGPVNINDRVAIEIDGVGRLENTIVPGASAL